MRQRRSWTETGTVRRWRFLPIPSHTRNLNRLPWPGVDSTQMRPSIISTRRLLMVSPRPVPPYLRVVEPSAWLKAWKSRPACSGVMPMPVSSTLTWSCTRSPSRAATPISRVI